MGSMKALNMQLVVPSALNMQLVVPMGSMKSQN